MGNVTGSVAAKFAFFPPDPPTYDVFRGDDGRLAFSGVSADRNMNVHLLDTKAGNRVVATFWKHPFARFTLLYSHGNAADLGQMHELFVELRAHLRVNIMRYPFGFFRSEIWWLFINLFSGFPGFQIVSLVVLIPFAFCVSVLLFGLVCVICEKFEICITFCMIFLTLILLPIISPTRAFECQHHCFFIGRRTRVGIFGVYYWFGLKTVVQHHFMSLCIVSFIPAKKLKERAKSVTSL